MNSKVFQDMMELLITTLENNSMLVNGLSVTDLVAATITAATGGDLVIANAAGKDIKVEFSDAAGARKIIFYDSADAEIGSIDSNGLFTAAGGFAGALAGNVVGNVTGNVAGIETLTAKTATDLTIVADGDEDVVVKMGDAIGVNKVLFKDSADALQASIDSDGTLTAKKLVGPVTYAHTDTSGAPTNAECVSAFGAAATVGAGFIGIYQDDGAEGKAYVCVSNGTAYSVAELTAAA